MIIRRCFNALIRLLARLLLVRVQVTGLEHVPKEGRLMIMFNHINFLDGPLVLGIIPRDTVAMTKYETFRDPILGPLAWLYGAFPVRRGEVDRRALQRAREVLVQGTALLYSPEGHRSGHGRLQRAKHGLAYIALQTEAMILPVAVTGVEDFWRNVRRLRRTDVQITIGRPFRFAASQEPLSRDLRRELTAQAMYQLAKLLPAHYRGFYNDLSQAAEGRLRFLPSDV